MPVKHHNLFSAPRYVAVAVICMGLLCGGTACNRAETPSASPPPPLTRAVEKHGVTISFRIEPSRISLDEDVLLTIQATYPKDATVQFPDVPSRIEGLELAAELSPPATSTPDGKQRREWIGRLTPQPATNYRIAPMIFQSMQDEAQGLARDILTPAIRLEAQPLPSPASNTMQLEPQPTYIMPPPSILLQWGLLVLLFLALIGGIIKLLPHLRRKIRVLRMSPQERALHDLEQLLAEDLHTQGQFKLFYHRITAIIRRFIEKQYGIRAPELTTTEFLAQAARNPAFPDAVLQRLQQFLEAADLVKFAAFQPSPESVTEAICTARSYLQEAIARNTSTQEAA